MRRPWRRGSRRAGGDGPGELIDLSMLETQILCLTYYPVTYFEMLGRPWRDARRRTVPGVAQAKDGLVDLGCGTAQQWFDLCVMVGHPEWIDEESPLSITELANIHAGEIYSWVAEQRGRGNPGAGNSFPDSQRAGGQWREHRGIGTLPGARLICAQSAGRVLPARPPLPDATRAVAATRSGAAAG